VNNDWGSGWLTDHSAGSGPFQLARWERQVAIELVENPRYNLGPAPQIKRIVFPNILENTVQREMLGRGDADIAWDLSAAQLDALKHEPRFYVMQTPDLAMQYLGMDVKNVPAFGKAEVRRAVKYAIDYDGIIGDLLKAYRGQESQMVMLSWFVDYPDPDDFAKPFGDYTQKSLAWRLQYYNDPLVKLVGQAAEMQNTPERGAIYKRVNETMPQDGPFA